LAAKDHSESMMATRTGRWAFEAPTGYRADQLSNRGLAVVLSGGGTLGAFQVGVIDVFARAGIGPSLIVGTSVGAINAAFWAFNPVIDVGKDLLDVWLSCRRSTLFPGHRAAALLRLLRGDGHLYKLDGLKNLLSRRLDENLCIEHAKIPLAVMAADAATGERCALRSGPVMDAILASCAIPGVFPPVTINGRPLFDGGVVSNCDVEAAVDAEMSGAVAIDLGSGISRASGPLNSFAQAISFNLRRQTEQACRLAARQLPLLVLRASLPVAPALGDFRYTRQLFQWGQQAAHGLLRDRLLGPEFVAARTVDYDPANGASARATHAPTPALRPTASAGCEPEPGAENLSALRARPPRLRPVPQ